jgi:L-serine dehydratase
MDYGIFDILGPVMIGPSSSHTAGAARLGKIAAQISGGSFHKVEFLLYGSFAKTYRGHGTDKALVAGVQGMDPDDEHLRESLSIAEKRGLQVKFIEGGVGDVHPNTVKFTFYKDNGTQVTVTGSSIGGGNISIIEIDGDPVEFSGQYPTIIVEHWDRKGMISRISSVFSEAQINIATMKVNRSSRGEAASMIIETDSSINEDIVDKLKNIDEVTKVRAIQPV